MSSYLPSARSDDEHSAPSAPTATTPVASYWSRLATETPPVGMKARSGNGPLRLTISFGPFRLAGKILMTSAPASLAAIASLGVSAPSIVVRPVSTMALATDSETLGDARNHASAWTASMACDGCIMVPAPVSYTHLRAH